MYQLNPLMRNVLITTNEVIFHAPTKHTMDPRIIQQAIIIAEERFIVPALGFTFYTALVNEKNVEIIDDTVKDAMQLLMPVPANPVLQLGDVVNAMEFMTTDNRALWKQVLWKLCAECVMLIAYPEAYIQFGAEGLHHSVAPASPMGGGQIVGPDLRSVKWMMDKKHTDRIDPLLESLQSYICFYKSKYPSYTDCPCENSDSEFQGKKTNIILGLYDDVDDRCCDDDMWTLPVP